MKRIFNSLLLISSALFFAGCAMSVPERDFRTDMRLFVSNLASWAREGNPGFLVIPQNGQELFTVEGIPGGTPVDSYLNVIDGSGREDLYYGWNGDGRTTPSDSVEWLEPFLDLAENRGIQVLVTDYIDDEAPMDASDRGRADDSLSRAAAKGYVSFPAPSRGLEVIPEYPDPPNGMSSSDITELGQVENFLYLIDPGTFSTKTAFLNALRATDYDLVLIDAWWDGNQTYTVEEIASLKTKNNGGSRLVVSYMSIGEAEDYRPYWNSDWNRHPPSWLARENPHWPGNYKVRYWDPEWQELIFGSNESSLGYIVNLGFDGVYLDIIDAFEYFE